MIQLVLLIKILIDEFQPMKNEGVLPSSVALCGWGGGRIIELCAKISKW